MASFINQAQDPQLKALLQRHFPFHVQDYNIKVDLLQKAGVSTQHLSVPQMSQINATQNMPAPQPVTPRTNLQQFNDREMATAYLLTLKRAGREYAWAAMESSSPEIRSFLENAFQMCSHHAFDTWQYMVSKGYYPMEAAHQSDLNLYGQVYQQIPNTQNQMY